jgi:hypothetical protein
MKQGPEKLNIKRWLDKSLNFENSDYIDLKNSLSAAIIKHGFKLQKN